MLVGGESGPSDPTSEYLHLAPADLYSTTLHHAKWTRALYSKLTSDNYCLSSSQAARFQTLAFHQTAQRNIMRANTGAPSLRHSNINLILTHGCLAGLRGQAATEQVSDIRGRSRQIVPETARRLRTSSESVWRASPITLGSCAPPHTFKRRRKFENSQPPSSLFPLLLCLTPRTQPSVPCYRLLPSPTHAILMFQVSPSRPLPNLPDWPSSLAREGRQLRRRPEVSSSSGGTWIEEARARVHCSQPGTTC